MTKGLRPSPARTAHTDTVRGLACIMLVAYHVVGPDRFTGMRVGDHSVYRTALANGPELWRMPLFTFLSGFVYAYRPVSAGDVGPFIAKKARRLLIPLVVVSTIAALVQSVVPSTNSPIDLADLWRIYIWPFGVYWYLHALFLIFLVMVVLDRLALLATRSRFAVVFLAAIALFFAAPHAPGMFGLGYAIYLLPFFLWGVGVNRFGDLVAAGAGRAIAMAVGVAAVIATIVVLGLDVDIAHDRLSVFGLVVGLCVTLGVQTWRMTNPWLARLGTFSYAVYLFHVFGSAGARIVVRRVIDVTPVVFAASLAGGLLVPIAIALLARRHPWPRLLLLGEVGR